MSPSIVVSGRPAAWPTGRPVGKAAGRRAAEAARLRWAKRGNAWWYTQVLLQSTEIIGTQAGAHHYLTSITLLGIAQWNSVGVNNVVGSASVSISASTATSCTLFINVNDSSRGTITVWASNTAGQDWPYISFS